MFSDMCFLLLRSSSPPVPLTAAREEEEEEEEEGGKERGRGVLPSGEGEWGAFTLPFSACVCVCVCLCCCVLGEELGGCLFIVGWWCGVVWCW
jgi:hypothetical protein